MNVRFNREELANALTGVCHVTSVRTPKDILKSVRMEAHSDYVLLSATDLEVGIRCAVSQVEVAATGEVVCVADTLAPIVRECDDDVLAFESTDNILHIRGGDSHFQVVTQDGADFPPVTIMEGEPDFTIDQSVLARLIEWTSFAAARESTRYAINGVLWEIDGERLTLAATDGRRLARATGDISDGTPGDKPQPIVPGKALVLVRSLPSQPEARTAVKITGNQLVVAAGGVTISTSLVEGHFPRYKDVIPTDCDREVTFSTAEFQSALKRVSLLTNEESKGVRLSFADGSLTLSSRAPEQGEATVSLPIEYRGEPVEIGFNPVFLLDVLRVVPDDTVTFAFKAADRPGVLRLSDDFVHVVMPVSLT